MADSVNRSGSGYSLPRDGNRVPAVGGVLASDGVTVKPIELDSSGNLNVNVQAGGGGGTQYTDGGVAPTHPIGPTLIWNNGGTWEAVSAANPLPVSASVSITGVATAANQTNATQKTQIVDGSGNVIASTSNALNVDVTNTSIAVTGTFYQATQPVSLATNTPTLQSGSTTAVTQATAANLNATVTQVSGNWNDNVAQINGHTALEGGTNGSLAVGGGVATNVAITTNPVNQGAQAVTSENSAITTGRMAQLVSDKVGKLITLPYANPENFVSGVATATGASDTAVISAQGSGLFLYITSISVANTGSTASLVTIEWDTASAKTAAWYLINPAGGGDNITFPNPLKAPVANKNVGFVCGSSSTTQYCSISGYYGL